MTAQQPHIVSASAAASVTDRARPGGERRGEPRQPVDCDLWMIDHHGSTVLRCRCSDVSRSGMRLNVPLGYGVSEGQRYELRSHLPGTPEKKMLGLVGSRWATIVRSELKLHEGEDRLDVGVVLDATDHSLTPVQSF